MIPEHGKNHEPSWGAKSEPLPSFLRTVLMSSSVGQLLSRHVSNKLEWLLQFRPLLAYLRIGITLEQTESFKGCQLVKMVQNAVCYFLI